MVLGTSAKHQQSPSALQFSVQNPELLILAGSTYTTLLVNAQSKEAYTEMAAVWENGMQKSAISLMIQG